MSQQRIKILPPHIVNRIAAGEVVERPASVVKELVENALDAGATRLDIIVGAGGRNIRIADNGAGMSPEDARLAFLNHATSKLSDEEALFHIGTLGFRGEALASIAAISRVVCLTRTQDAQSGVRVVPDSGTGEPQVFEAGCNQGTIMEVSDLFYNTPARLKFLKRPQTETAYIEEIVQMLALSHPAVQFQLTIQDKSVLKTRGAGDCLSTLQEVFHLRPDEAQKLIAIQWADAEAGLRLSGYISMPEVQKSQKRWIATMVNRRNVRCAILTKALESAYASLLPEGRYPIAAVFLDVSPEDIDVNVHPAKREVRYAKPNEIFSFIRTGLLRTLEANGYQIYEQPKMQPEVPVTSGVALFREIHPEPLRLISPHISATEHPVHQASFISNVSKKPVAYESHFQEALSLYHPLDAPNPQTISPETVFAESSETLVHESIQVIGQFLNTYILLETRQGLMIVDQHIASERTFFEAFGRMMEKPEAVQTLLTDIPIAISPVQRELLEESRQSFHRLGFQYDFLSDGFAEQALLKSIPLMYRERTQPQAIFQALLQDLEETGDMRLNLDHLTATLACHSAVRAGDLLSRQDMVTIIEKWLDCRLPWTCPHGRPIAHTLPVDEINRFFDRQSLPVGQAG